MYIRDSIRSRNVSLTFLLALALSLFACAQIALADDFSADSGITADQPVSETGASSEPPIGSVTEQETGVAQPYPESENFDETGDIGTSKADIEGDSINPESVPNGEDSALPSSISSGSSAEVGQPSLGFDLSALGVNFRVNQLNEAQSRDAGAVLGSFTDARHAVEKGDLTRLNDLSITTATQAVMTWTKITIDVNKAADEQRALVMKNAVGLDPTKQQAALDQLDFIRTKIEKGNEDSKALLGALDRSLRSRKTAFPGGIGELAADAMFADNDGAVDYLSRRAAMEPDFTSRLLRADRANLPAISEGVSQIAFDVVILHDVLEGFNRQYASK